MKQEKLTNAKLANIANKINKLKIELIELANEYNIEGSFSQTQINVELCNEAAEILSSACKHLTLNGTKY